MKILIFGATGRIGSQVVMQALEAGHFVTAFARSPAKLNVQNKNLTLVPGDVLDYHAVEKAMGSQDAVLCSLGGGRKGTVRSEGTRNIILAMEKKGSRRFICQTTLGAGDSRGNLNFFWKHIMFGMLLKKAYADHEVQERYVFQCKLDWTIVRPGAFTDGPRTDEYLHGFSGEAKNLKLKISCADVARFMLKQLHDDTYLKKTPGLSY